MAKETYPASLARLIFIWGIATAFFLLLLSVLTSFTISQSRISEEAENLGRSEIARIGLVAERTTSKDRFLLKEIIAQSATIRVSSRFWYWTPSATSFSQAASRTSANRSATYPALKNPF